MQLLAFADRLDLIDVFLDIAALVPGLGILPCRHGTNLGKFEKITSRCSGCFLWLRHVLFLVRDAPTVLQPSSGEMMRIFTGKINDFSPVRDKLF